ncbi:MAG: DNA repair protein [Thermodesulfobacteriota bacterium]|nr:MAG: DNA repair protein [Thermodesulfobacteriota bacterium]
MVYYNRVKAAERPRITSSFDAYKVLFANWNEGTINLFEEFYILLLDRSNRVMGRYLVSQGGIAGTLVDAKLIFAAALKTRASGIILSHNHPSGNLEPSPADIELTDKLIAGGKVLDIFVLDHLILSADNGYYSFADEGRI